MEYLRDEDDFPVRNNRNRRIAALAICGLFVSGGILGSAVVVDGLNQQESVDRRLPDFIINGSFVSGGNTVQVSSAVNIDCRENGVQDASIMATSRIITDTHGSKGRTIRQRFDTGVDTCAAAIPAFESNPQQVFVDYMQNIEGPADTITQGGSLAKAKIYSEVISLAESDSSISTFTYRG